MKYWIAIVTAPDHEGAEWNHGPWMDMIVEDDENAAATEAELMAGGIMRPRGVRLLWCLHGPFELLDTFSPSARNGYT